MKAILMAARRALLETPPRGCVRLESIRAARAGPAAPKRRLERLR
ncbi:hypothetical protein [Paraburkholderia sprentiae]|nr:hypothetical protein [Paraburkholderia sprentiae]